jgi:uncharacterized caspase-like protein
MLAASLSYSVAAQGPSLGGRGEDRIALIIGNAGYAHASLRNPVNDARAVADALRELGFEVVYRENAALEGMLDAMREFVLRSRNSAVRVFFYAGHGAQLKGRNYLIPVDTLLKEEEELPLKTANASEFVDRLGQSKTGVNIVILDACRNQPFPVGARTRGLNNARSLAQGLAQVAAPRGTLVAFSTAPGAVALDGGNGNSNSAYTRHLVEQIRVPGLPVEQLFKRVRIGVSEETRQAQIPWESSSLMGEFCFRPGQGGECAATEGSLSASSVAGKDGLGKR